jgi:hypothetical protein
MITGTRVRRIELLLYPIRPLSRARSACDGEESRRQPGSDRPFYGQSDNPAFERLASIESRPSPSRSRG